jgi:hypothetical protein
LYASRKRSSNGTRIVSDAVGHLLHHPALKQVVRHLFGEQGIAFYPIGNQTSECSGKIGDLETPLDDLRGLHRGERL